MQAVLFDKGSVQTFSQVLKNRIKMSLGSNVHQTHFANLSFSINDRALLITAPNELLAKEIETKFLSKISRFIDSAGTDILGIKFTEVSVTSKPKIETNTTSIEHLYRDSELFESTQTKAQNIFCCPIDSSKTFTNFIPSVTNLMALTAAKMCSGAEGMDTEQKLHLIYGSVGNGKTHLLHAIANELTLSGLKVNYITAEKFLFYFVKTAKENRLAEFKEQILDCDAFLIDDLQVITSKKGTIEELYQIVRSIRGEGKLVVLTSSIPPSKLEFAKEASPSISTFLSSGSTTQVSDPDLNLRLQIIKSKSQEFDATVEEGVLNYLASSFQVSIREIEGLVAKIYLHQKVFNQEITLKNINDVLSQHSCQIKIKIPNIDDIINKVAEIFSISTQEIKSDSRLKNIKTARQVAMFVMSKKSSKTLSEISQIFGKKSHATVIHSIKYIQDSISTDLSLSHKIHTILETI